MEIALFLILPLLVALFLVYFYKKEVTLKELCIVVIPSIIIIGVSYAISYASLTQATEYYGDYVVKITHYDDWDEWIERTCTRRVPCGRDSKGNTIYRTETYDCSYRDYHPERWVFTTKNGDEFYTDKLTFDKIKNLWKTPEIFKDMHRRYYTKDGDAQYHVWDNNRQTLYDITKTHNYTNKIKASKSIFSFEDIDRDEAVKLGLFEYPKVRDYIQNPINGYRKLTYLEEKSIRDINALYGKKHQIRVFINCFYNKDLSISKKQQSYWVGGNKNEFIINICLDSLSNKLLWTDAFSWMDKPTLEVYTEQFLISQKEFNIIELANFLEKRIPSDWKRKEFKNFNYLSIELTETQFWTIFIILIIYLIGSSIYVIINDEKNE